MLLLAPGARQGARLGARLGAPRGAAQRAAAQAASRAMHQQPRVVRRMWGPSSPSSSSSVPNPPPYGRGARANCLVTWDIDGTLMGGPRWKKKRGGSGDDNSAHKAAIERAMRAVWHFDGKINEVPHAGCTDRAIVRDVCRLYKVPDDDIWAGMDDCIRLSSEFIAETADHDMSDALLPGIPEALTELNKRGVYCGLVTGNFQQIGWTKLQRAGIRHHFELGAFGSDCLHRNDILSLALERAVDRGFCKEFSPSGALTNVYHVGDAVADMQAARHVGGRGIGVLTGAFTEHDLSAQDPYVILPDLTDTNNFLRIVGLHG